MVIPYQHILDITAEKSIFILGKIYLHLHQLYIFIKYNLHNQLHIHYKCLKQFATNNELIIKQFQWKPVHKYNYTVCGMITRQQWSQSCRLSTVESHQMAGVCWVASQWTLVILGHIVIDTWIAEDKPESQWHTLKGTFIGWLRFRLITIKVIIFTSCASLCVNVTSRHLCVCLSACLVTCNGHKLCFNLYCSSVRIVLYYKMVFTHQY